MGENHRNALDRALIPVKPRLRGWIHLVMTPIALVGGLVLIWRTPTQAGRLAATIYLLTALMLFGDSALYHRGQWSVRQDAILRRFDHSNIAIFIAGTYTPLSVGMLRGNSRVLLLSIIWGCAAIEVLCRNLWMDAPRWLYTALYIVMGWTAVFWLGQFWHVGGPAIVLLLLAGGLFYTFGAVVYAMKRPNPSPQWFGFHEIFHAGTALGAICHFAAIWLATTR